jgi:hypothetical protein
MEHPNELPFNYLNEKSKKMEPRGVLTKEEDVAMIAWILTMQECGFVHYLTTTEDEGCIVT